MRVPADRVTVCVVNVGNKTVRLGGGKPLVFLCEADCGESGYGKKNGNESQVKVIVRERCLRCLP